MTDSACVFLYAMANFPDANNVVSFLSYFRHISFSTMSLALHQFKTCRSVYVYLLHIVRTTQPVRTGELCPLWLSRKYVMSEKITDDVILAWGWRQICTREGLSKEAVDGIMGNAGSSIIGAWPIVRTKSQNILASVAYIFWTLL